MKGHNDVVALLGELLANELTAVNQYLLHAETCANWGYHRLAEKLREEAEGERQHASKLIERMMFLDGAPDLRRYHAIRGGTSVKELLERDLEMEYAAITALDNGIALCRARGDNATEHLLTEILTSEVDDTQWIESQLELMRQVGEQNYLAQQL
jgi:bacterioferritin